MKVTKMSIEKLPWRCTYSLDSNNISYEFSINLYLYVLCYIPSIHIHSSWTICLYTTVCSVCVLMHAAELLQLFHHVLPKAASCRASHVALGHCKEYFVWVRCCVFVHLFSIVWLWQVHRCMLSFVLLPFSLLQVEHIRALPALG